MNKVLLKLYTLINFDIDKLGLGFVLLFDRISCSVGLLCFETIVNTNNDITYNERSNEFLTTRLDMSLIELKWFICDWIKWNWCEPRDHVVTQRNQDWDLIPKSQNRFDKSVTQWKPALKHQHYWNEVKLYHETS